MPTPIKTVKRKYVIRKKQRAPYTFRNRRQATLYAKDVNKRDRMFLWSLVTRFPIASSMDQHLVTNSPFLAEACKAAKGFPLVRAHWLTTQPAWGYMLKQRADKRAVMQGQVPLNKFRTEGRWMGAWKTRMKRRLRMLAKTENKPLRAMLFNGETRKKVMLILWRERSCRKHEKRRRVPKPIRSCSWSFQDSSGQDDYPDGY